MLVANGNLAVESVKSVTEYRILGRSIVGSGGCLSPSAPLGGRLLSTTVNSDLVAPWTNL